MQYRGRDVPSSAQSLRGKRGASLGERSTIVDKKGRKPNVATPKLILIEWLDALAQGEWHEAKKEDLACTSVGYLVYEDDEQIELAGTITHGMCNNSITLPKRMILKRKELKVETTIRKGKRKKPAKVGEGQDTINIPQS
jgi:hypothetical protein